MDDAAGVPEANVSSTPGHNTVRKRPRLARRNDPSIYFILCSDAKAAKIGYALDPFDRMADLQVGNPFELTLIASARTLTASEDERRLHRHLDSYRMRGEWFRTEPAVMAVAESIISRNHRALIDSISTEKEPNEPLYRRGVTRAYNFAWKTKTK